MPVNKRASRPAWRDSDDAPELTEEFFERADEYVGEKLVRRGRPPGSGTKELVSLRIDRDVLSRLRAGGRGWQTRANDILRQAVAAPTRTPRRTPTRPPTRRSKAPA
jgi:uncharacterized protein (DUF4415 family)